MKSTYRLVSIFLDRKNLPGTAPVLSAAESCYVHPDISEGTTLFNYTQRNCRASGKYLLSQNGVEPIMNSINQMYCCRKIAIVWDYLSKAEVANLLFAKRLLQIALMVQKENPRASIAHAVPGGNLDYYREIVNKIYATGQPTAKAIC